MPPVAAEFTVGDGLQAAGALALHGIGKADAGVGSALLNTSQQVGGAVGTALLNTVAVAATTTYIAANGVAYAGTLGTFANPCTMNAFTADALRATATESQVLDELLEE